MKRLNAKNIERLENTSVASTLVAAATADAVEANAGGEAVCDPVSCVVYSACIEQSQCDGSSACEDATCEEISCVHASVCGQASTCDDFTGGCELASECEENSWREAVDVMRRAALT